LLEKVKNTLEQCEDFWNQYFLKKISTGVFELKEHLCDTGHATISPTGVSDQHWRKKRTAV
jgi:hypothetical protein